MDQPRLRGLGKVQSMDPCLRRGHRKRGNRCAPARPAFLRPAKKRGKGRGSGRVIPRFQPGIDEARQGAGDEAEFGAQAGRPGHGQAGRARLALPLEAVQRAGEAPGMGLRRGQHAVQRDDAGKDGRRRHGACPETARKKPEGRRGARIDGASGEPQPPGGGKGGVGVRHVLDPGRQGGGRTERAGADGREAKRQREEQDQPPDNHFQQLQARCRPLRHPAPQRDRRAHHVRQVAHVEQRIARLLQPVGNEIIRRVHGGSIMQDGVRSDWGVERNTGNYCSRLANWVQGIVANLHRVLFAQNSRNQQSWFFEGTLFYANSNAQYYQQGPKTPEAFKSDAGIAARV